MKKFTHNRYFISQSITKTQSEGQNALSESDFYPSEDDNADDNTTLNNNISNTDKEEVNTAINDYTANTPGERIESVKNYRHYTDTHRTAVNEIYKKR